MVIAVRKTVLVHRVRRGLRHATRPRLGVRGIEVGFGGPIRVDAMERMAEVVGEPVLYGLSRVNLRVLDRVLDSLARAAHPRAIFSRRGWPFR